MVRLEGTRKIENVKARGKERKDGFGIKVRLSLALFISRVCFEEAEPPNRAQLLFRFRITHRGVSSYCRHQSPARGSISFSRFV